MNTDKGHRRWSKIRLPATISAYRSLS